MVVHGMSDMAAGESHDVSTKKNSRMETKTRCPVATHLYSSGWAVPTGACGAVPVTEQGNGSPWGRGSVSPREERLGRDARSPFLGEADGRGLGLAEKEGRAPGGLSGTQDTWWEPEVTSVRRGRSRQQLLGAQVSKISSTMGNAVRGGDPTAHSRGMRKLGTGPEQKAADIRGIFQAALNTGGSYRRGRSKQSLRQHLVSSISLSVVVFLLL